MSFIILDRDGVINYDSKEYIKSPDEFIFIPGSIEAIVALSQAGFRIAIATNQSGIARGLYDETMLKKIHAKLIDAVMAAGGHLEDIFFCPHHPDDHCACRKPKPGLLHQIQEKYSLDLHNIYFIGDSLSDIEAAQAAGCIPLLVLTGKEPLAEHPSLLSVKQFKNLETAVAFVLQTQGASDGDATFSAFSN